ncbi:hypothetical protein MMC22_009942 [Lobaria immixta]|nr:hypothetical protein [Lobaria immixta]
MYLVEATETGMPDVKFPPDFINQAFDFQKLVAVALILTWSSIVSVKFSYLFLFKRLIDRLRPMVIYWWIAAVYNGMISAYGAAVYIAVCPDFYNYKSFQCAFGKGVQKSIALSVSQMVLDIVGDILILYIPFRLIWKISIRWSQKIVLLSCLSLTILTILCTIIRISGIHTGRQVKSIDSVWETYWQFIAANIALTMTAATAFRTFFVSRVKEQEPQVVGPKDMWYTKGRRLLRSAFTSRSWRSKSKSNSFGLVGNADLPISLSHKIPRATMTGVRTFIIGQGRMKAGNSQVMAEEESEDLWPRSINGGSAPVIQVQQEITSQSDDAS